MYGFSVQDSSLQIVTELAKTSLFDLLHKQKLTFKPTPLWQWKMAQGIIMGINYLHANNVIHRDLKSLNVLVRSTSINKVLETNFLILKFS